MHRSSVANLLLAVVTVVAATCAVLAQPAAAAHRTGRTAHAGAPVFTDAHISRAQARRFARTLRAGHYQARRSTQLGSTASDATTRVTVTGSDTASLVTAVRASGGRVLAATPGRVSAVLSAAGVETVQRRPAVRAVTPSVRAFATAGPVPEGTAAANAGPASKAGTWQAAGITGSGVDVGVVDVGFAGLSTAEQAGSLPAGLTVAGNHCSNVNGSKHGTAVTEVVHQMAPGARLHLYCVQDNVGFAQAETELQSAGVRIVNSSLAFPGDSRGDGTGDTLSTAATVRKARQAGILWVESAGNSAEDHWSGYFADADHDDFADLTGTGDDDEFDAVEVPGTDNSPEGGDGAFFLQWDQWPASSAPVSLMLFGEQCLDDVCATTTPLNRGNPYLVSQHAGGAPVLEFDMSNSNAYDQVWYAYVQLGRGFPAVRYSLSEEGTVSPSYLAGENPTAAAYGSIETPASSPYAVAVGASDVGADGTGAPTGAPEPYSSRGQTIDGRVKPDITGWDGVSTTTYGAVSNSGGTGFYGTSAAAPGVAGAAALVRQADPLLDASGLQAFLEQRAQFGAPQNPPHSTVGHGVLTLGAPTGVHSPSPARYAAMTPVRVLDTRSTLGGHHGRVGAGGTVTVPLRVPADATAVAVNLTGTGASGSTYLSAYPSGSTPPQTSNVNLSVTDRTAAVLAVVALGPERSITIRNGAGSVDVLVDELGYFGTGSEIGRYTPLRTPTRVLDTRGYVGGHHAQVGNHTGVIVHPNLPSGSTAAVVNITTGSPGWGYLSAAPTCSRTTSTLNYARYARANLAIVSLTGTPSGFCVENSGPAVNIVVDVVGYLGPSGSGYVALPNAQRIVDTRVGNGGSALQASSRALAPNSTTVFYGSGVGDVPAAATALMIGITEAGNTAGGYFSVFPGASASANSTSELNFTPGRAVPNADLVGLSAHEFGVFNHLGYANATVDLFGYFVAD